MKPYFKGIDRFIKYRKYIIKSTDIPGICDLYLKNFNTKQFYDIKSGDYWNTFLTEREDIECSDLHERMERHVKSFKQYGSGS